MSKEVKDVMVRDVKTANAEETVLKVADTMNRHEIGSVIITENGKPAGIVTERDILKRVVSKNRDPAKTRIREVMSSPLVTIEPAATVKHAAQLMIKQRIKKLAVANADHLVGILSLTDLLPMLKESNRLSLKNAPERMKKVFEIYYDPIRKLRKNCPLSMIGGNSFGCSGSKCMWFVEEKCIFLSLAGRT